MSYEIKEYSEEFLEKQVEIGTEIIDKWLFGEQTSLENLRKIYSGENFDPSTRFYAFKGEDMVGFITANIQPKEEDEPQSALLEFPIVLEPHKDKVQKLLLNKAYSILKDKGVQKVLTRVCSVWGNTVELAKEYGYKEDSVAIKGCTVPINNLSFSVDESLELLDYEPDRDDEALIKMYVDKMGIDKNQIKTQLEFINNNKEKLISWKIVKDGEEVIASSLAILNQSDTSQVQFTAPYVRDNIESYTNTIFAHHLRAAKEQDVKEVSLFLAPRSFSKEKLFQELGFNVFEIKMFAKELA